MWWSGLQKVVVEREFPWATADGKPPPFRPRCGFMGNECPLDYSCLPPPSLIHLNPFLILTLG